MKKAWGVGLLVGILIAGTAVAARRNGFSACEPRWIVGETLMRMNVSEQQKSEIATILRKHKQAFQVVIASLKSARADLRKAMRAEPNDKKTILTAYHNLCDSGEKFLLLLVDTLAEVRDTLTPAQKDILRNGQSKLDETIVRTIASRRALLREWIGIQSR